MEKVSKSGDEEESMKARKLIVAVGSLAVAFELLFPPLRSPAPYYNEPQQVNQDLVAVQISRFSVWRPHLARLEHGTVVRTEIDSGEFLRELVFLGLVFGAMYLRAPLLSERVRSELVRQRSESI